jgi:hypothetical protein
MAASSLSRDRYRGTALAATDDCVRVIYGRDTWSLRPGELLTLGRSRNCDVQLPDDDHLSRHAGTLQVLPDCVLVRNDSASKPLVLRPPAGEDQVVEPRAAATSRSYGRFAVVFPGRNGIPVRVDVDASTFSDGTGLHAAGTSTAGETVTAPVQLTASQLRVLAALCAPLLTRSGGRAVPATYAQIGRRLDRSPGYVRNVLKGLRESLSGYGIAGLTSEEPGAGTRDDGDDFRWALARCAVRSGWVGRQAVAALPPEPGTVA